MERNNISSDEAVHSQSPRQQQRECVGTLLVDPCDLKELSTTLSSSSDNNKTSSTTTQEASSPSSPQEGGRMSNLVKRISERISKIPDVDIDDSDPANWVD